MKRARLNLVHQRKLQKDDLSFLPTYSEHAKYLRLADDFLRDGSREVEDSDVIPIRAEDDRPTRKAS